MYEKNLCEDLRLRLTSTDMEFLKNLSSERAVSVSECIRSIIGEYRRSLETISILQSAINLAQNSNNGVAVHGNTKTYINDQL